MTSRRGFLLGATAFLAAPAIVRARSIMPVRRPRLVETDEWTVQHITRPINFLLYEAGDWTTQYYRVLPNAAREVRSAKALSSPWKLVSRDEERRTSLCTRTLKEISTNARP